MQPLNFVFLLSSLRVAFSIPDTSTPFTPYQNDLQWDDAMSLGIATVTFQYQDGQPITLAEWTNPDDDITRYGLDTRDAMRAMPQKGALVLKCGWQEGVGDL
ncbi:hypothetical protein AC578_8116 [Pseudocercospora eumusae]|uniref:Uncharacterized protein n=1 Tax=Pseudocercospora eumusae TaxID=321146 RepID=A0A139H0I2_9PEZI|nr:hypothetical protein AC578_8116 [Pseudocercospora eumusae]